jgi:hypothetical protein
VIYLPENRLTEHQFQARADRLGIALHALGGYWRSPTEPATQAIIIGYAIPAGHACRPALRALTQLLAQEP